MKKELIYKIKNKDYLLMQIPIQSQSSQSRLQSAVRDVDGITQGVESIIHKGGFLFSSMTAIFNVLIPVNKIKQFDELLDKKCQKK